MVEAESGRAGDQVTAMVVTGSIVERGDGNEGNCYNGSMMRQWKGSDEGDDIIIVAEAWEVMA